MVSEENYRELVEQYGEEEVNAATTRRDGTSADATTTVNGVDRRPTMEERLEAESEQLEALERQQQAVRDAQAKNEEKNEAEAEIMRQRDAKNPASNALAGPDQPVQSTHTANEGESGEAPRDLDTKKVSRANRVNNP